MKSRLAITIAAAAFGLCFGDDQKILGGEGFQSAYGAPATSGELEQFIQRTMAKWKAPGMAVAIIDGNSTWMKGFGQARMGSNSPVTPTTLFFTGSTTKSFTAAAMAQLVEDGRVPHVQWNASVSSLMRDDFVLSDPWATEHVTIEDALSHRTGYPAHDFVTWRDPKAATRGFRHLPMSAEPRTKFQYCNQMFTAIGYLIEKIYGGAWLGTVFMTKLWIPMGMRNTVLSLSQIYPTWLLADELWYHNDSDSYVAVPHAAHRGHEGAGMVISCVADYQLYLRYMMSNVGPISPSAKAALLAPHTVIAPSHPQYVGPYYYGLGWVGGVFEGEQFWFHDGQMREHVTEMWMFPKRRFGVVIMANANSPAMDIVLWKIIYDHFGVAEGRRLDMERRARDTADSRRDQLETCISRLYPPSGHPPLVKPLPLAAYVGTYGSEGYGDINVTLRCDDSLKAYPGDTPAHPTLEGGCHLTGAGLMEYDGKSFHLDFEHVSGDFWVAWMFVNAYAPSLRNLTKRPQLCLRAQFRTGPDGSIETFGGDFRREGEDGPLVWYTRRR